MSTLQDSHLYGSQDWKSLITGSDPSTPDPYDNNPVKEEITDLISSLEDLFKQAKTAHGAALEKIMSEISNKMNYLMFEIQQYGSNVVGQDSETQKVLTGYLSKVADIQSDISDQTGDKTSDLESTLNFLLSDPLDKNSKTYKFFQKHKELYENMKANITTLVTALGGAFTDGTPPTVSIPSNAIKDMWDKANGKVGPSSTPDPTQLQDVMNAIGSINQSYTSGSAAMQAAAKTNVQTFNAEQGSMNKFLQAMVTLIKSMVQGQKTQ